LESQSVADGTIDTTIGAWQAITGDTNWHDIDDGSTAMAITLSDDVLEDDIIEVFAKLQSIGDGTYPGVYRAVVVYDATVYEVTGSGAYQGAFTDATTMVCAGQYVMPAGKSGVVVKLQGKVANAGGTLSVGDTGIHFAVKVLRRPG
jgi:hypothetical protein